MKLTWWRKTSNNLPPLLLRGHDELVATERIYLERGWTVEAYWRLAACLLQQSDVTKQIALPLLIAEHDAEGKLAYQEMPVANAKLADAYLPLGLWELPSLRPIEDVRIRLSTDGISTWVLDARQRFRWVSRQIPAHLAQQAKRVAAYGARINDNPADTIWYCKYRKKINANALVFLSEEACVAQADGNRRLAERHPRRIDDDGHMVPWIIARQKGL